MKRAIKIKIFLSLLLLGFFNFCYADTLYLKNGHNVEGLIKAEDNYSIDLEFSSGIITFRKDQVEKISRSSRGEARKIRERWKKEKEAFSDLKLKVDTEGRISPGSINFVQQPSSIFVSAVIDNKVQANLLLDTGASITMLSRKVGEQLGVDFKDLRDIFQVELADGRRILAKYYVVNSIRVQDVEARGIPVSILMQDIVGQSSQDGLLGMSFLSRFRVKIDYTNKTLQLEKLE